MKKPLIKGLSDKEVNILLSFIETKLKDKIFINSVRIGGNECNIDWIEDDMDISGDDMIHLLFEVYGEYKEYDHIYYHELIIEDLKFLTEQHGENWSEEYIVEINKVIVSEETQKEEMTKERAEEIVYSEMACALFHVDDTDLDKDGFRYDEQYILDIINENREILKFFSLKQIISLHFGQFK